jgi:hypothetical protein
MSAKIDTSGYDLGFDVSSVTTTGPDDIDWSDFEAAVKEQERQPTKPRTTKQHQAARTEARQELERKDTKLTADQIVAAAKAEQVPDDAGERVATAIAKLQGTPPRPIELRDVMEELRALRSDVRDLTALVLAGRRSR